MSLPKVLIIGQPFNNNTGGGITLTNLFKSWEKDRLAVACSGYLLNTNVDTDICENYYQLGYQETKWRFPFNLIQGKYFSGRLQFQKEKAQNIAAPKSKLRVKLIMKVFVPFLQYSGLIHIVSKTKLSAKFQNWLTDFEPDIIYVQPTSRDGVLFCLSLKSFLRKPMVFHIMDDWPSIIADKGIFKKLWTKVIGNELRHLLDKSDILLSISEEMSNIYKLRYHREFIPFHNSIDVNFWGKNQKNTYKLTKMPIILYAGRTGLGIDSSLEQFAKGVQEVNTKLNMSLRFILQAPTEPSWCKSYRCVEYRKFGSYSDLPITLSSADFLLLPYDFTDKAIKYIKYSMPTKAPEYMMNGTPIILFAPQETAIVKYCQKFKCAKIIRINCIKEISLGLTELILNESERKSIANNAKFIASQNHDSVKVRRHFENIFTNLIRKSN